MLSGKNGLPNRADFGTFESRNSTVKTSMIMKLRFFIKKAPKRGDSVTTATIYARLTIGHKTDISATLPLSVNLNHWDVAGQCVKARAVCDERMRTEINNQLLELRQHVNTRFTLYEGKVLYREWLREEVMEFFGIKPNTRENKKIDLSVGNDFFALMDKFIEQRVCSKTRRQHYISLRERLCRFVAYKMLVKKQGAFSLSVHRFTNDLFVEFSQYLEREYEYISVYPRIFEAVPYSKYYKPRPMGANTLSHLQNNLRIFLK